MRTFLAKALGALSLVVGATFLVAVIAWFAVPRYLGWQPQVVLSGSMEPKLHTGGVAFVKPIAAADVKAGNVLTFRRPDLPGVLVSHRVTEVVAEPEGPSFKTKGDANDNQDDWTVPAANVVGTVEWSVPYLGYVTQRVRTPQGFLLIIALPAAYILFGEFQNIGRQLRKARQKEASL